MIGTGAGKVEGLTGAGKFGGSSVGFSTAFVPSQELTTLRNVGDEVRAAILSNMLRGHLADTLTRLRTTTRRRPAKEGRTANFARALHGWTLFRPASFLTRDSSSGRNCSPNGLTNVRPVRLAISEGNQR